MDERPIHRLPPGASRSLRRSPVQPTTLYLQFHGGVYRSDDGGESWIDIGAGLPSGFGLPLVADAADPDRALVIPLSSDGDRVTPEGRGRVFETKNRGATWARDEGFPGEDSYLTVLRRAFCHDGSRPLGLYFGPRGAIRLGRRWRHLDHRGRASPVSAQSIRCSS